jgi:hypothetical protein
MRRPFMPSYLSVYMGVLERSNLIEDSVALQAGELVQLPGGEGLLLQLPGGDVPALLLELAEGLGHVGHWDVGQGLCNKHPLVNEPSMAAFGKNNTGTCPSCYPEGSVVDPDLDSSESADPDPRN